MTWKGFGLLAILALASVGRAAAQTPGPAPRILPRLMFTCGPADAPERFALVRLEQAEPSAEARERDIAAARAAAAKAQDIHRAVKAGEPVPEPYGPAAEYVRRMKAAKDPLLAELFRRTAEDQLMRSDWVAAPTGQAWAAGLSENVLPYAYALVGRTGCGIDQANTTWLKAQLATIGWFRISRYGAEADAAAWLLAQHADQDRAFQQEVLATLEPLAAQGETRKTSYAYLHDRVAVARSAPQRFGTQGRCTAPGVWEPSVLEAPDQLDARRAAMGLPSEAIYQATVSKSCAGFRPPAP